MRKGTQKYAYNRAVFGQLVADRRQVLGLSLRALADRVFERTKFPLNPGTLHQVELGWRSLPESQREALYAILELPGGEDDTRLIEDTQSRTPSLTPAPLSDDPLTLEAMEHWNWEPAKEGWLRLAGQSRAREQWPEWADYTGRVGKMLMMLGRYEEAAAVLETVLDADHLLIGQSALGDVLLNRGWLAMVWRDFRTAAYYLRQSDRVVSRLGMNRGLALHFLGRTYCEWGIAEESDRYREAGRELLASAYDQDKKLGDSALQGFDLLQQIPGLILDDVALARTYLYRSADLLGTKHFTPGNIHLKHGLIAWYLDPASAREHLELASQVFARGKFYVKGVAASARLLSRHFQDQRASLPQAAAYALVAAIALPYAESLELLEEVSAQVLVSWCDGVVRRHTVFWREQIEHALQMDVAPFDLLRALAARPNGLAQIQWALERAQAAIRNGLPEYLTTPEQRMVTHCLVGADVG